MSIEADFRTTLSAHAPLTALISTRLALNALPDDADMPAVVYSVRHDRTSGLSGALLADQGSIEVQCWSNTAASAQAVADAVVAAVATAPAAAGAVVIDRADTFDADMGTDGVVLTVEWWD
jgi:hypothetical protein